MVEITGVHRGFMYSASYSIDAEQTSWKASFRREDEVFSREGRLVHRGVHEADVHNRVHIAIQRYIERILVNDIAAVETPAPPEDR